MMKGSTWLKLVIFCVTIIGMVWSLRALGIDVTRLTPEGVRTFVLSFGIWGPIMYLLIYGQPIVPLPSSILIMTAGLAFGPLWGTLAALSGATSRACGQFCIARMLGREAVAKLLKGKVASLDQKIGQHGFNAVLLIRLIPNIPFDMQNYTLGFSRVRFAPYALATFLGMIPACFVYVYLGYSLTAPKQLWKLAIALLLIIGFVVWQRQYTKRKKATS